MSRELVQIVGGNLAGNDIKNAASEHTLKQLLDAVEKMSKGSLSSKKTKQSLNNLSSSANNASNSTRQLANANRTLANDLKWLTTRGFRLFTQGLGAAGSGLVNLTAAAGDLAFEFIDSRPDITRFTASLADSRLNILGLGTAIHRITQMLMGNYGVFQTLTQNGIFLGNRISQLQSDIANLGVDARTFASIIGENSELFARFGSASQGASQALRGFRSITGQTREELMAFGLTFEEQAELFARGFARNTVALRRGTITQDEVVNLTARYARDLRRLAEITGVSVAEQQEAQRRAEAQRAFQLRLQRLRDNGEEELANQLETMAISMYNIGEGVGDLFIGNDLGIPAFSDAALEAAGMTRGLAVETQRMADLLGSRVLSEEELQSRFRGFLSTVGDANRDIDLAVAAIVSQSSTGMDTTVRIVQLSENIEDGLKIYAGNVDKSGRTIITLESALNSIRQGFADLSSRFLNNETVQRGFEHFSNWIGRFANWVETANFDNFSARLFGGVITSTNEAGEEIKKEIPGIFKEIFEGEGSVFSNLSRIMGESFRNFWEGENAIQLRNIVTDFFRSLVDNIIISINESTGGLFFKGAAAEARLREDDRIGIENLPEERVAQRARDRAHQAFVENSNFLQRQSSNFLAWTAAGVDTFANTLNSFLGVDEVLGRSNLQGLVTDTITGVRNFMPEDAEDDAEDNLSKMADGLIAEYEAQMGIARSRFRLNRTRENAAQQAELIQSQLSELGFNTDGSRISPEKVLETFEEITENINRLTQMTDGSFSSLSRIQALSRRQFDLISRYPELRDEFSRINREIEDSNIIDPRQEAESILDLITRRTSELEDVSTTSQDHESERISRLRANSVELQSRQIHQENEIRRLESLQAENPTLVRENQIELLKELNKSLHRMIELTYDTNRIQSRTASSIGGLGSDLMRGLP